jgi:hypothetical protein
MSLLAILEGFIVYHYPSLRLVQYNHTSKKAGNKYRQWLDQFHHGNRRTKIYCIGGGKFSLPERKIFFEVENQLMMIRHFWRNLASVILLVICVCIAGIRYKLRKWTLPFWTVYTQF